MKRSNKELGRLFEGMADAVLVKYNLDIFNSGFHLFSVGYFENCPVVKEDGWHYFRDAGTHSALIWNEYTNKIKLIEPKTYWNKSYRKYLKPNKTLISMLPKRRAK